MDKLSAEESKVENRPSVQDFYLYLPWAYRQLQVDSAVIQVTKVYQNEYTRPIMTDRSKRGRSRTGRLGQSRIEQPAKEEKSESDIMTLSQDLTRQSLNVVKLEAIHDYQNNLVQLKFEKNSPLPRIMMKIIGLIIGYHPHLHNLTINGRIDRYTIHEISNFLHMSYITDLCLDGCFLKEPNYELLLENANFLKYLSLGRCKIDDITLEMLCAKLTFPLPASKMLSVLNLSSNRITDEGAKVLATCLRRNRQLSYLNLASNMITDKGALAILDTLKRFPLTAEEESILTTRYTSFLKKKNASIVSTITELRTQDLDKKTAKRNTVKQTSASLKKAQPTVTQSSLSNVTKCLAEVNSMLIDKAIAVVDKTLGEFVDPYNTNNTFVMNGVKYCKGNNYLCCLNISYNYISFLTLKKIGSVLMYQKLENRTPLGLVSVTVEGNSVPISCKELTLIDDILEMNQLQTRKLSVKKRRLSKIHY